MKRALAITIVCLLLFTGCISNADKKTVNSIIDQYFTRLKAGEYDKANLMAVQAQEEIAASIEASPVNDLIFKDIKYEVWSISKKENYLVAETVITQISLKAAYIDAVKEYSDYVELAKSQNKSFTDQALEEQWNKIFYKHVADVKETTVLKCDVYIDISDEKNPKILITADFRNCLFGGELDAIKILNQVKGE